MKLYVEPCFECGRQYGQWVSYGNDATRRRIECECGVCSPWVNCFLPSGRPSDESPWRRWNLMMVAVEIGRDVEESFQ